jgi:hypothetical protein
LTKSVCQAAVRSSSFLLGLLQENNGLFERESIFDSV